MPRSIQPPTALDDALEALYGAFCGYQGTHISGCPCCVSSEENTALRRPPLRQLTRTEVERYFFKAMTTWGTEEDFKHFVPRLIELYASSTDAWLLCEKLAYAGWCSWAEHEQRAIEQYLMARWHTHLAQHGLPLPGDALLETMVTLDLDIAPYDLRTQLDAWRSEQSRESTRHLARFVLDHGAALLWSSPSVGRRTLWQARPKMASDVREWLLEPATRERLEASFVMHGDDQVARAFDWLEAAAKQK